MSHRSRNSCGLLAIHQNTLSAKWLRAQQTCDYFKIFKLNHKRVATAAAAAAEEKKARAETINGAQLLLI